MHNHRNGKQASIRRAFGSAKGRIRICKRPHSEMQKAAFGKAHLQPGRRCRALPETVVGHVAAPRACIRFAYVERGPIQKTHASNADPYGKCICRTRRTAQPGPPFARATAGGVPRARCCSRPCIRHMHFPHGPAFDRGGGGGMHFTRGPAFGIRKPACARTASAAAAILRRRRAVPH